jgi:alkylation response protein AidB-like acyl-CoA dehydrogenase
MLASQLPNELRDLAALAASVADKKVRPHIRHAESSAQFSTSIRNALANAGLLGLVVPERFGGCDSDARSEVIVVEEIAKVYPSAATYLTAHWVSTKLILAAVEEGHKSDWIEPALAHATTGEWLGAIAATEPDSGSDLARIRTTAKREGDSWVINGVKRFITNGGVAEFYVVLGRTGADGAQGISLFFVPASCEGVSAVRLEEKMGLHGSATAEMVFDHVRVPTDHLLGEEGGGFKALMKCFDQGRVVVAAISLGIAASALDHSIKYAATREQFGRVISEFQGIQFMLADMAIQVSAARSLVYDAAEALHLGLPEGPMLASMAKTFSTEIAETVTSSAVQIHGGYGYTRDYPVEMLMRDNKVNQIYEGTNQIQRIIIARSLLKDAGGR